VQPAAKVLHPTTPLPRGLKTKFNLTPIWVFARRADELCFGFDSHYRQLESRSYCARSRCANADMAAEVKREIELEIAHVLFTDLVATRSCLSISNERSSSA
jgi:hypothetical protein